MKTILSEVKGFTPIIDVVADDLGLIQAVVYGVVWRYCQMDNGVCQASIKKIADHVNLSKRTIIRHIKELEKAGYIEDTTPELRNKPHTYKDTGKVKIVGLLEVKSGMTESHTDESAMTESHTRYDRESHHAMTESHLKIHETIEETDASTQTAFIKQEPESDKNGKAHFVILARVCLIDLAMATKTQKDQLGQSAKMFKAAEETPDRIANFGKWWNENDWRGKKGQPPTPAQVREKWGEFKQSPQYNGTSLQAFAAR